MVVDGQGDAAWSTSARSSSWSRGWRGWSTFRELANKRVRAAGDVVKPGQDVKVRVLEVDKDARRVSLSLKAPPSRWEPPRRGAAVARRRSSAAPAAARKKKNTSGAAQGLGLELVIRGSASSPRVSRRSRGLPCGDVIHRAPGKRGSHVARFRSILSAFASARRSLSPRRPAEARGRRSAAPRHSSTPSSAGRLLGEGPRADTLNPRDKHHRLASGAARPPSPPMRCSPPATTRRAEPSSPSRSIS